ncbi:hypothetical protein OOK29_14055 [Streptomyces phaeochromogenes]|uniref:hypothetical protein n=1 Tax=Streptomyces phaeochromogenes TaxID=1923 RepID=UPI002259054C|nr:hypothetical protein [Streptomyces phaeochromogenes]MCX5599268.1 hypothetical protein [Streptomyces phaeochromogenes]
MMKYTWTTRCAVGVALAGLTATATAASPALGASSGPAEIVDYTIKRGSYTPSNSDNYKSADARCPTGTVVLGGGGQISGAGGRVGLRVVNPHRESNGRYRVTVAAAEIPFGTAQNWQVRAYAVCGKKPAGYYLTGWKKSVTDRDRTFKTAAATCPGNRKPLGYGAKITGADGNASLRSMFVPAHLPRTVSVSGSEAATNARSRWSVSSQAVCADVSVGQREKNGDWSTVRSASVFCPADRRPLGAGVMLSATQQTLRNLLVRAVYPFTLFGGGGSAAQVSEDWNGTSGAWKVRAQVICVP